jgi:ABC-type nitrate/sulfonate/bicarbonate transport system substrate-binding protein
LARVNLDLPDTLTVSGELIEKDPEHVARVVARLLETHQWAQSHVDETWKLLAQEIDATEEVLRIAHGPDLVAGFDLNLDAQSVAGLESQKEFLLRHGFITHDFDLSSWIDPAPLERAKEILRERAG